MPDVMQAVRSAFAALHQALASDGIRLGLAEKTVKHCMRAILGKLEAGSRVEAALIAYKAGLRPDEWEPEAN